jgi:hypothetical protein
MVLGSIVAKIIERQCDFIGQRYSREISIRDARELRQLKGGTSA